MAKEAWAVLSSRLGTVYGGGSERLARKRYDLTCRLATGDDKVILLRDGDEVASFQDPEAVAAPVLSFRRLAHALQDALRLHSTQMVQCVTDDRAFLVKEVREIDGIPKLVLIEVPPKPGSVPEVSGEA